MDITAIETFCRAAEAGNLTQAAKLLNITKSVASRRLQALEAELGVRLLARTTRGVTLTDEGSRFFERCQRILEDLEDAAQAARGTEGRLIGRLRLAAPRALTDLRLAKAFSDFAKHHPDLTMEMNLTDERVDLTGGGYDVGLRVALDLTEASLVARKIARVPYAVVASPDYLKSRGRPSDPTDLVHHTAIFYSNLSASKQWTFEMPDGPLSVRVTGQVITNSGIMQTEAACAGLGISILPRFFVSEAIAAGRLEEVLSDCPHRPSHLYALYPERRLLPQKVRAFIDYLADWFKGQDIS